MSSEKWKTRSRSRGGHQAEAPYENPGMQARETGRLSRRLSVVVRKAFAYGTLRYVGRETIVRACNATLHWTFSWRKTSGVHSWFDDISRSSSSSSDEIRNPRVVLSNEGSIIPTITHMQWMQLAHGQQMKVAPPSQLYVSNVSHIYIRQRIIERRRSISESRAHQES